MSESVNKSGLAQLLENLKNLPANFKASINRRGPADGSTS